MTETRQPLGAVCSNPIGMLKTEVKGDSEIEKLLFLALSYRSRFGFTEYIAIVVPADEAHELRLLQLLLVNNNCRTHLIVRPQAQIGNRRVDFLIHAYDWRGDEHRWGWRKLIVECDGHEFHERTKEQATRDRSRDRMAVHEGYDCFRFTGSEIWRDPWGCSQEITDWAIKGWP